MKHSHLTPRGLVQHLLLLALMIVGAMPVATAATAPTASATPEEGCTYRIWNASYNTSVLYVSGGWLTRAVQGNLEATDKAQFWTLEKQSDGTFAFKNSSTDTYIKDVSSKNSWYGMASSAHGFTVQQNSSNSAYYDILSTSSYGFNATDQNETGYGYKVVSWDPYNGSSELNSAWIFEKVSSESVDLDTKLANGAIRIQTRRENGWYITDTEATEGNTCLLQADKKSTDYYWQQVWIPEKSGAGYTLRNLKSGKYLMTNSTSDEAKVYYFYLNADNAAGEEYVNFSTNQTQSGSGIHYQEYGHVVVEWAMDAGEGSDWIIEDVSDEITTAIVREQFAALSGEVSTPAANTYYVIRNVSNNAVMTESYTDGLGTVIDRDANSVAQLWRLVPVSGKSGCYNLQNALTGNYIQYANYNAQHSVSSSATSSGFQLSAVTASAVKNHYYYAFLTGNNTAGTSYSLHRSSERLLTWNSYTEENDVKGSIWYFQQSNFTDAEIATAQAAYKESLDEKNNASKYTTALATFFTDKACTTLKSTYAGYTDANLKTAMQNAGINSATLQEMAVKIKNGWTAAWDKTFRSFNAQPQSNPQTWANELKITQYTEVPSPTGIVVSTGNLAYVFVGGTIPTGCSVELRAVNSASDQGAKTTLSEGLNIVPISTSSALFVNYIVPTSMSGTAKLSDFAALPIHIEGGKVNGYIDLTRSEIGTNEAWQQMKADGLLTSDFMQMKGNYVMMNMQTSYVKQHVGDDEMVELVGFWDWLTKTEQNLMGIGKYREQGKWNDREGCYSVDHSYMYATTYGTYYNVSTLSTILNYKALDAAGGALWGPAHEMGHNHQQLINTIGTTEVSNNLFAEVAVFLNGKTSTRSEEASITGLANHYASGTNWIDLMSDNWYPTRMYYQLYLYYEVLGHHPGFWAEVFDRLRQDPIDKSGTQSNPCPATNDFLKLALTCCDVAQEDLSEFFQAYGMFVPFSTKYVEDYANYYIENTQAMIDATKAKMQQYSKKNTSILFIEDHIKQLDAADRDGNPTGAKRSDYSTTDAVGKLGDTGNYTDYADNAKASGYYFNYANPTLNFFVGNGDQKNVGNNGAVGFKIYNADGDLLYFTNQAAQVSLPNSITSKYAIYELVVTAVQADGTEVVLPKCGNDRYALTIYRAADADATKSQTLWTDLTDSTTPVLEPNDLVFIENKKINANFYQQTNQSFTIPEKLTQRTNYVSLVDNTASSIVLTDKTNFVSPIDFTAKSLTYSRSNTAGWNSVCLPFAVTSSDFGTGASIETFSSLNLNTSKPSASFTPATAGIEAGVPCLVNSTATSWSISKTNATVVHEPKSVSSNGATLTGSFLNQGIGAGNYKLNTSGTAFGVTTEEGQTYAFRCYIDATDANLSDITSLAIQHGGATTGIESATSEEGSDNATLYDLSGRRITRPAAGGVYIQGGKKVIM